MKKESQKNKRKTMSTKKFTIIASVLFALSVVVTPVFAACSLQTPAECDNAGLLQLIAQLGAGTTTTTTTTTTTGSISGIPAGFQFTQNLKQGSTGIQVKYLQILLNSDPATAVGNAGAETSYFGALTKAAVNKFQTKYAAEILTPLGLTAPTGNWASGTRAKANAILAAGGTGTSTGNLPAGCTSTAGYSTTTGVSCATGTGSVLPAGCTTTSGFSPITGQACSSGTTVPVTGGFAVRLAADNPASSTLITGQATADLAHFTFSNGTGTAVNVTGIELTRIGVSADATLANAYLFNGATRLTDAGTVSSGKVNFNATNGLFSVPANSTITVTVKSDIAAATQGQTIGISLSGVTSNGTLVNTTLPIAGNIFNIANANLATVAVANVLPGATFMDPVSGATIWQANLQVGVNNVNFTKLALKQINSVSASDISNFKLTIDGVEVATVASLDANNFLTFTFDKTLNTGTRSVKVLADITGGSSRIISMSLRNRADIDVKDAQYGVNVSATGVPATAGPITINPGQITVTVNNSSLPVTVANSASNVLIGKYTFKAAGEAIRVDNLYVGMTLGADIVGATLRNGKVMINGSQAGSTANIGRTALTAAGLTPFAINYTFQPGVATTVEIYADIFNNGLGGALAVGNTVRTDLLVPTAGLANGTRQVSLGLINVPSVAQNSASISIGAAASTLVATSDYTAQNTVVPQSAFKIGSWTMKAGTAEDINVNNLSFAIASVTGATFDVTHMANMYVVYKVGSGAATTTSVVTTPATPQAFSVSFAVARTQSATIELYADLVALSNTAPFGAITPNDSVRATLTVTGTGSQSGTGAVIPAAVGQVITSRNGTITVTRDAATPNSALVAQNNTISSVAYKFAAANDSFDVTQLSFSINDPSAVAQVNLMDGTTVLASSSPATVVTFNGFATPITINANQSKTLTLQLVLGAIGTGSGNTGANVTSDFIGGPASTASLLRPASTGIATGPAYTDNPGNAIFVYQSVPTITLVSLPSGTLQAGTNTIAKFQVGTTGGQLSWKNIVFSVSKTAGGGKAAITTSGVAGDVSLWDVDNNVQITPSALTLLGVAGGGAAIADTDTGGTITFVAATEQAISGARNYELRANITVTGAIAVGDYFQTRILNPSTVFTQSNTYANAAVAKYLAANGWAYTGGAGPVANPTHTRLQAAGNYTAATVAADATVVGHDSLNNVRQAFGIPASFTMTLAEGAVDNQIAAATFTVAGVTGLTCTPFNTAVPGVGAVAVGDAFNTIQSVLCTGNGMRLALAGITVTNDTDALGSTGTMTVTVTKQLADLAAGAVAANSSDIGLALSAIQTPSFVWSDNSAASHSEITADWTTDYLVKNLPTSTQNLVK
ncbi:MAG: hypothetical protein WC470_00625 [Candidatus Paceibacterota bacterium]